MSRSNFEQNIPRTNRPLHMSHLCVCFCGRLILSTRLSTRANKSELKWTLGYFRSRVWRNCPRTIIIKYPIHGFGSRSLKILSGLFLLTHVSRVQMNRCAAPKKYVQKNTSRMTMSWLPVSARAKVFSK